MTLAIVELVHERQQIRQRCRRRQPTQVHPEAGLRARANLVANVNLGSRVVADEDNAETRRPSSRCRKRVNIRKDRLAYRRGHGLTIQQTCAHFTPIRNHLRTRHVSPKCRAWTTARATRTRVTLARSTRWRRLPAPAGFRISPAQPGSLP